MKRIFFLLFFIISGLFVRGQFPSFPLGSLYNAKTWSNLSAFNINGATASVSNSKILLSATGAVTFTKTLDINRYSNLEKWTASVKIKVGAASGANYGIGIGMRSYNSFGLSNALGRIDFSNTANGGKLILNGGVGSAQLAVSDSALLWSNNDYIILTVERNGVNINVSAHNFTTKSNLISVAYSYPVLISPYRPNTGMFSLFALGGSVTIDSLSINTIEPKKPDIVIVGDSKSAGQGVRYWGARYSDYLSRNTNNLVNHSAGFDRTIDVLNSLPELSLFIPNYYVLEIGSNDVRTGIPSSIYLSQYDTIVAVLQRTGATVIHLLPFYESGGLNQDTLYNHILTTFPNNYIDTYSPLRQCSICLTSDGVHPNDLGNLEIYYTIIKSKKLMHCKQEQLDAKTLTIGDNSHHTPNSL